MTYRVEVRATDGRVIVVTPPLPWYWQAKTVVAICAIIDFLCGHTYHYRIV